MREVESLPVDDPDEHLLAEPVFRGRAEAP